MGLPDNLIATTGASVPPLITVEWDVPACANDECVKPNRWQLEYEDEDGRRISPYLSPVLADDVTGESVAVANLQAGTRYTFFVRGILETGPESPDLEVELRQ